MNLRRLQLFAVPEFIFSEGLRRLAIMAIMRHRVCMSWIKQQVKRILPNPVFEIRNHWKAHGVFPNIVSTVTFSDKILHRRIFDRRALLSQLADKAAVRLYVQARLGTEILTDLYHLTVHPDTIPFDELPNRFVVKPTHGSGWVQIVPDKSSLDRAALIETCNGWLKRSYYRETREWVYKDIEPRILVEEFIDDGSGNVPNDYKFFVFDGKVDMVQVDTARFTDHRRRLYSPTWERLGALLQYDDVIGDVPRPPHLAEMITAAATLGAGLDFVRADFYDTGERIYFGELTNYPGAGLDRFRPTEFDRWLGERWKVSHNRRA